MTEQWELAYRNQVFRQAILPEEWNLSHPEEIARVHRSYVEAGSTLIQTNTFGANRIRLERYHLEGKIKEIIHQAARSS